MNIYIFYLPNNDYAGLLTAEHSKILGILIGIGATPFLRERFDWFWIVGLVVGLLTILIGGALAIRYAPKPERPTGIWARIKWAGACLLAPFKHVNATVRHRQQDESKPLILLPYLTVAIGFFIALPALTAWFVQWGELVNPDLIEMYFGGSAIFLWILGEGFFFYPYFIVKPKRIREFSGMARSILLISSAIFIWVFLGLDIGLEGINWLFWAGILFALVGLLLSFATLRMVRNSAAVTTRT